MRYWSGGGGRCRRRRRCWRAGRGRRRWSGGAGGPGSPDVVSWGVRRRAPGRDPRQRRLGVAQEEQVDAGAYQYQRDEPAAHSAEAAEDQELEEHSERGEEDEADVDGA